MKKITVKFRKRERGFTLIELLIVIAILGVLAAVVVPNVMGMFSRGGSQAWVTDQDTMRASAASYYADVHNPGGVEYDALGTYIPTGHFWPTYSGAKNDDANSLIDVDGLAGVDPLIQIVDGMDWAGAAGLDVDSSGVLEHDELMVTAIVAMPILENVTNGVTGAYLDVPESATDSNNQTITIDLAAPAATISSTSLQGTHTWYIGVDGKLFSFYRSGTTITTEEVQSDFSGSWP